VHLVGFILRNCVCIESFGTSNCSSDKLEINSVQPSDGMRSVAYQGPVLPIVFIIAREHAFAVSSGVTP